MAASETSARRALTGETQTSAYRCFNPLGKIPLLQDGDLTVTESPAIVAYIGERYGTDASRLVPRRAHRL